MAFRPTNLGQTTIHENPSPQWSGYSSLRRPNHYKGDNINTLGPKFTVHKKLYFEIFGQYWDLNKSTN